MPVSKYITREEFDAKHSENLEHFNVLAEGMGATIIAANEVKGEVLGLKVEVKEVKDILNSVGFNGSTQLVKEFLTYAPELVREGRTLRRERALWEAHDLIRATRRERWGSVAGWWATPRRVTIAILTISGAIATIIAAGYTIFHSTPFK